MIDRMARLVFAIAAAGCSAAILFSLLSPFLHLADSVSHFRLHLSVVALLPAFALLLTGCRRMAIASFATAALGFANLGPALHADAHEASAGGLKLIQLNLDFSTRNSDQVRQLIRDHDANMVTLQEVTRKASKLLEELRPEFRSRIVCPFARVGSVAVVSKLPTAGKNASGCLADGAAWIRLAIGAFEFSLVSIHLHWPYPYQQAAQIRALIPQLKRLPGPLLIAGDFNAAPWSAAVQRIADATGTRVASGLRMTHWRNLPTGLPVIGLPIDHVLIPDQVSGSVSVGDDTGSDHLPLVAILTRNAL